MTPMALPSSTATCTSLPFTYRSTMTSPFQRAASTQAAPRWVGSFTSETPTLEPSQDGFTTTGKVKGKSLPWSVAARSGGKTR